MLQTGSWDCGGSWRGSKTRRGTDIFVSFTGVQTSVGVVVVDNTKIACERLCLPCWAFITILFGVTVGSVLGVYLINSCCCKFKSGSWKPTKISSPIGGIIVICVHVAVTVTARFCKYDSCCNSDRCLPCWVYCLIILFIICVTITVGLIPRVLAGEEEFRWWTVLTGFAICSVMIVYVAAILSALFCKVAVDNTCLPCWAYGVILGCVAVIMLIVLFAIKGCYRKRQLGQLKYWELAFAICSVIFFIGELVVIVVTGYCENRKEDCKFGCWEIYLIVCGASVVCWSLCILIYIIREPVYELRVVSRKIIKEAMDVDLEWKCRMAEYKTFSTHLQMTSKRPETIKTNCKEEQRGELFRFTITGLMLDAEYNVLVASRVCKITSAVKTLQFNTKGQAVVPKNIIEDETKKSDTTVRIRWQESENRQRYVVMYRKTNAKNIKWVFTNETADNWYILTDLNPGTCYTIHVFAMNDIGKSKESEPLYVKTAVRPSVPVNVSEDVKLKRETSVTIFWQKSTVEDVFVVKHRRTKAKKKKWTYMNETKDNCYTLTNLKPATTYTIRVFARNDFCRSEDSKDLTVKTAATRPDAPSDFTSVQIKDESVMLVWNQCRTKTKQKFRLTVFKATDMPSNCNEVVLWIDDDGSGKMEYLVKDLEPETEYTFEVVTVVGNKISDRSELLRLKTKSMQNDFTYPRANDKV